MKKITPEEFDATFDNGEDVSEYIEWSRSKGWMPAQRIWASRAKR